MLPVDDESYTHDRRAEGHDRRSISIKEIVLILTLLLNFSGLVWGAATMESSIQQLQLAVTSLNSTVAGLVKSISDIQIEYNARIRVLENDMDRRDNR